MVDHPAGKGPKIALENSGLVPKFCKKKGYGTTPKYITKRKEEEHRAHEEYEQYIHSVQKQGAYYEVYFYFDTALVTEVLTIFLSLSIYSSCIFC